MHKVLKTGLIILLLALLLSSFSYCSAPFDTQTAHVVNVKKAVTGSGFLLRKETLVKGNTNGVFETVAKDGTRVSRGSSVGVIISGNLDKALSEKLEEVSRRIEEIKQSGSIFDIYSSDEARIFSAMKDITSTIRQKVSEEDFISARESTLSLSALVQKKNSAENMTSADKLLVSLEDEKYNLEQQLGGIREEVLAPASGYFYTTLDGLEGKGNEKDIAALSASDINNFSQILKDFDPKSSANAKISDTYVWYLAATVPLEDAQLFSKGQEVSVSIDESPAVKAKILAVNTDASGEAALILKCDRNIVGIYEKRTAEFEICIEEYSGLYIPSAAVRVVDDIPGVYVMTKNKSVAFKCIDILLSEDNYYIAKNKYEPPEGSPYGPLKVYDNILVNPEAVKGNAIKE
ncbi:MAG: hypothetical protein IJN36_04155 [Clostridia bacterium]|nr:hypothetical protein [Clostridia bacterium]